jgi:hypothetical protein
MHPPKKNDPGARTPGPIETDPQQEGASPVNVQRPNDNREVVDLDAWTTNALQALCCGCGQLREVKYGGPRMAIFVRIKHGVGFTEVA